MLTKTIIYMKINFVMSFWMKECLKYMIQIKKLILYTPINFIDFKGPLYFYKSIFNGDTNIDKVKQDKKTI